MTGHLFTAGRGPGGEGVFRGEDVLGDVDGHGAGAAGFGEGEGERDNLEELGDGTDQEVVLRDREREAVGVDFLKGVGADQRLRHLGGDRDQRDRVEAGVGDGGEEIGGTGAGGGEAHGGAAGDARHALGDESGALFMAGEDVFDARVGGVKRVVERQDRAARDAGDGADALAFEQVAEDFGAGEGAGGRGVGGR